uniref:T-cell immunoglobulin and mucin domain-containing protein 4-like n=1 Tax=Diabrotica virgifera virgifera TaxID=50390 RepID=A0A6P7GRM3_DIAVI
MRAILFMSLLCAVRVESQFWSSPNFLQSWFRQAKNELKREITTNRPDTIITTWKITETTIPYVKTETTTKIPSTIIFSSETTPRKLSLVTSTITSTDGSTIYDTTNSDVTGTTEEPRDNSRNHDFYLSKRERPQIKISTNISQMRTASSATPTRTQSYSQSEPFSIPSTTPTSDSSLATPIQTDTDTQSCTGAEDNTESMRASQTSGTIFEILCLENLNKLLKLW